MPFNTDIRSFVGGVANENPAIGWWNTPSLRGYGSTSAGGGVSPTGTGTQVYTPPNINYTPGVQNYGGQNLGQLTEYINSLQRTAQTLANQARIPGAAGLEAQSSENIGADLRGEIDSDVLRLLQQQGAERGVGRGYAGSPNESAAYLQALGLTSYARKKAGQEELTGAYARNPAAPLFDPSKMLLTPAEADQLRLDQERLRLAGVTEANRTALEQQRLAQDAVLRPSGGAYTRGGGGGGGGFGGGSSGVPDYSSIVGGPGTRSYGATGEVLGGTPFGQSDWWKSIGYGPTSGANANTTVPYYYAGANTGGEASPYRGGGNYYAGENISAGAMDEEWWNQQARDLGLEGG